MPLSHPEPALVASTQIQQLFELNRPLNQIKSGVPL